VNEKDYFVVVVEIGPTCVEHHDRLVPFSRLACRGGRGPRELRARRRRAAGSREHAGRREVTGQVQR
jgi:hypothetical protein